MQAPTAQAKNNRQTFQRSRENVKDKFLLRRKICYWLPLIGQLKAIVC